jgi:hypothetical protein
MLLLFVLLLLFRSAASRPTVNQPTSRVTPLARIQTGQLGDAGSPYFVGFLDTNEGCMSRDP